MPLIDIDGRTPLRKNMLCLLLRLSSCNCGTKGLLRSSAYMTITSNKLCFYNLSSSQLATALRPFYFAVHPDLFGQHPKERIINENSLKQLTAFIEMAQQQRPIQPTEFTFFLRPQSTVTLDTFHGNSPRPIHFTLIGHDLHMSVRKILSSCNLSTLYLDSLPKTKPSRKASYDAVKKYASYMASQMADVNEAEEKLVRKPVETLGSWLYKNSACAKQHLKATRPIREETEKLREELCSRLGLKDLFWSCGWGIAHFKGCLQSLDALRNHHPTVLQNLTGRTVVFGNLTGVSLDGHIILSSGDVRNSWLELIKRVKEQDLTLKRIPAVEKAVSRVLHDIKVVHRKFQPTVTAQNYESQLRTLSATIADYWVKNGFPPWPTTLQSFQLVVECDAGPLMLSPTGQFIVPASCPAFLIINFITENIEEAQRRLDAYERNKHQERNLHRRCIFELKLADLQKDDNVTPDRMIRCCQRLLQNKEMLLSYLEGTSLHITHFYSVLQDGEMCLPWNWEC